MAEWAGAQDFVNAWIDIHPVESVRDAWHQAECGRCSWTTTGTEPVCESAAYDHAEQVHKPFGSPAPLLEWDGTELAPAKPVLTALPRHPSFVDAGWRPSPEVMTRLRHMALCDIIDSLDIVGYEVRIQVREKRD